MVFKTGQSACPLYILSDQTEELQIRGDTEDNSKIIFLISQRDGTNDGSQNMFVFLELWLIISKLSLLPHRIWITETITSPHKRPPNRST